jgi:hypothetical protein
MGLLENKLQNLFGILQHAGFGSSSILIDLLFRPVCTHGYLFYTLGCKLLSLYLVARIVLALTIGSAFSWLLCPLTYSHIWALLFLSTYFLVWCSWLTLSISHPHTRKRHCLKKPWLGPGMVVEACNPSYARGASRRIVVQNWPRQNAQDPN